LFNAWAKLETKTGSLSEARDILKKGMLLYPKDHTVSLIVVAGVIFGFIDQSHSEHMFIICIAFSSSWQH
jgi:hypothetical protein